MSAFIKSLDTSEIFVIPKGETCIGRGPFLKVVEKKVSRNHALIVNHSGEVSIKPIHKNPTFLYDIENEQWTALPKDDWKVMSSGDQISLLPDSLKFVFEFKEEKNTSKLPKEVEDDETKQIAKSEKVFVDKNSQKFAVTNDDVSKEANSTSQLETAQVQKKTSPRINKTEQSENAKSIFQTRTKRKLPSWMVGSADPTIQKTARKSKPRSRSSNDKKSTEVKSVASADTVELTDPRNQQKNDTSKKLMDVDKPSIRHRQKSDTLDAKKSVDRPQKSDMLDELMDVDKPVDQHQKPDILDELMDFKKPVGRQKQAKICDVNCVTDGNESDVVRYSPGSSTLSQLMENDKHLTTSNSSRKQPVEDSEDLTKDTFEVAELTQGHTASTLNTTSTTASTTLSTTTNKNTLPRCPYGKGCYRKNPIHFTEYSHNDDDDDDDDDVDDDSEKPECQYGISCYRTNPQHLREYKHTKDITKASPVSKRKRPARKAKGKSVLDDASDDDGESNNYDYDDSFLDDDVTDESFEDDDDDSDYRPPDSQAYDEDDGDDVTELMNDAKDFIDNKKMQK